MTDYRKKAASVLGDNRKSGNIFSLQPPKMEDLKNIQINLNISNKIENIMMKVKLYHFIFKLNL